jgi:hypothetical protein
MAFSAVAAKAALKGRITAALGAAEATIGADKLDGFADALVAWIGVDVLPTLTVTTTVSVASVSGVTTGGGVSGPGAGTGAGTVS